MIGAPAALGAAALAWSAPAALPGSATSFPFPMQAAMGANGTAAVVWRKHGDYPAKASVRVAVRDAHGRLTVRALSGARTGVAGTRVAVDDRGRVIVAWVDMRRRTDLITHGPFRIRVATQDRRGHWSPPVTVGRSRNFVYAAPDIAVDARGDAVVAWRGSRRGGPHGRHVGAAAAATRSRGGPFGRAAIISRAEVARAAPRVAMDARGEVTAVWTAGRDHQRVLVATRRPGMRWTRAQALGTAPGSAPAPAVDRAGAATVAWRMAPADSEGNGIQWGTVAVATRPSARAPFGAPVTAGPTPTAQPLVAMSPAGQTLVAWAPMPLPPQTVLDLHYASGPAGGPLGPETEVGGPAPAALAVLRDGTGLVASADGGITVRELPPGAPARAAHRIARKGQSPVIAAAGRHAIAVWLHDDGLRYAATRP